MPERSGHPLPMLARVRGWLVPAPDSLIMDQVRKGRSPWMQAIYLLWSSWVFITPTFEPAGYSRLWWILTAISFPLFLLLYYLHYASSRRRAQYSTWAMVVMAYVLLPWYPSGISYFVYGCVGLRMLGRYALLRYALLLAVLGIGLVSLALRYDYPWQMLIWIVPTTMTVGIALHAQTDTDEKDAALRLSQEEVRQLAATAERERIGRDLHDLLGHTLSLIALKLELARKLQGRDLAASGRERDEAEQVAREALAQVRSAVVGIRAVDLAVELVSVRLLLEAAHVQLEHDPPPVGLPPQVGVGVALLVREAATNIARHARARHARIRFLRAGDALHIEVSDDGRGGINASGNGIAGMRERVVALGGTLSIQSPPGDGTRVLACLQRIHVVGADALGGVPDRSSMAPLCEHGPDEHRHGEPRIGTEEVR